MYDRSATSASLVGRPEALSVSISSRWPATIRLASVARTVATVNLGSRRGIPNRFNGVGLPPNYQARYIAFMTDLQALIKKHLPKDRVALMIEHVECLPR